MENTLQWVERSRSGDRDAFARIIEHYQGMVSAVTLNLSGDFAQSEDLAQETFLTAWRKLPELREPEKLASWIYGIAKRTALHWREKQQRNPLQGASEIDGETAVDPRLERERSRQKREQSLELVWSTVKELPETFREPLLLYYRYSKSVADIAASMELTEDAVNQRLSRGRKMLKAEVEKQVESVLESTKPGEYFVVGVLAAIPVFAISPEVLAAGSAAGSAGAAAKSGGGIPLLASFGVYVVSLLNAVFFPLTVFLGVLSGAWNGIQNSPTLRSRRFMLKATAFQALAGVSLYVFLCVFGRACRLFIALDSGEPSGRRFAPVFLIASVVFVGLYCVVSSYVINRRWRKIVEEDEERPDEPLHDRLRTFFYGLLTMPFVAALSATFLAMIVFERYGGRWWEYFEHLPHIYPMGVVVLPPLGVLVVVTLFYFAAERMVVDEKSLDVWRPRIPNFLEVLCGREKPRSGLRHRTNFWSDLLLVGAGLCLLQGGICANYFFIPTEIRLSPSDTNDVHRWYLGVFAVSFIAYLLFAIFYAGIPRKRYWGYIYFGAFTAVLNTGFVLFVEPWMYGVSTPFWHADHMLGMTLFWLACFVMVGIAGLLAFRKRKPTNSSIGAATVRERFSA